MKTTPTFRFITTFSLMLVLCMVKQAGAQTIVIDDWTVPQGPFNIPGPPPANSLGDVVDGPGAVLGGERDIVLTMAEGPSQSDALDFDILGGVLSYSQTGAAGGNFLVIYDGEDNDAITVQTAGLQNFDLTNGGSQDALLLWVNANSAPLNISIIAASGPGNLSELTLTAPMTAIPAGLTFMFSDFTVSGGAGADFSNLGALILFVNSGSPSGGPLNMEFGPFETTDTNQPEEVLQGQMTNVANSSIIVSNFPGDNSFDAEVAEEITVPPGETWIITGFEWQATFSPNMPPDVTANIGMYNDNNGAPGDPLILLTDIPVDVLNNGVLRPDSYLPLSLTGGITYWVVFTVNLAIGYEHNVLESTDIFGIPFFWQNPGNAFGTGCTNWTPGNQCGGTESSLAMDFLGHIETPPLAPNLELEKTVAAKGKGPSADIHVGEVTTFTITVKNTGTDTARNFVVSDAIIVPTLLGESVVPPCKVTEVDHGSFKFMSVECTYAALGPGEERVITFDVIGTLESEGLSEKNTAVAKDQATQEFLADDEVFYTLEPNLMDVVIFIIKAFQKKPGNVLAKLDAAASLDVYVDSVRVADDLPELSGARIPVSIGRTAPVIELVDGADPDNSNPLASFTVNFVTEETGSLAFSQSNMFVVANAPNDSLTLLVKQNARTEASDQAHVELIIANIAAQAGALDFRVAGNGLDQTLPNLDFGDFSDYIGGAPGSYDIEILQSSDGLSLGTYRVALDAFQGQIVTVLAAPADSGSGNTAVTLIAFDSTGALVPGTNVTSIATGDPLPQTFALQQNYPNPFNPTTQITYKIPAAAKVKLTVYNLLGEQVRKLVDAQKPAGSFAVSWDGLNDRGMQAASGVYLYQMEAKAAGSERFVAVYKMLLLR